MTDRRWQMSGTAVAAVVTVLATLTALTVAAMPGRLRPLDVVCGVAAVLGAIPLVREPGGRRTELLGTVLGLLAAASPAVTPTATLATLVVARARPLPAALTVAAAGVAGHLVQGAWRPAPGLAWVWWALIVLAVEAALLGWGRVALARQQLLQHLCARAEEAEAQQHRRVAEARAAERARLAREMHDVLAHRLSLLAAYSGALEYRPDAAPEELARAAGVVREGVHAALEELREVIGVLRADRLADGNEADGADGDRPLPGAADIGRLVAEARDAGTDVSASVGTDLSAVPPAAGRAAFRVVQEGLTNARRHAPGDRVRVAVGGGPRDGLLVEVVSTPMATAMARPAPADPGGSGTGLIGLAERAELLGGRLEHGPRDGAFVLRAWVPWRA